MKNIVSLSLVFLSLSLSEPISASDKPEKLSVGLMESVVKVNQYQQYHSALVGIMHEVARQSHIDIDIKPMPLKRILAQLEQGTIDLAIGLYKRPEREKYVIYLDDAIGLVHVKIFYPASVKYKKFSV
ncbi:MAG: transporter substrate-binding domain-containing protein [Psychrobium sp.]|nr:transporter substrate-binding domain-containing protein [Psychrobium sp.]